MGRGGVRLGGSAPASGSTPAFSYSALVSRVMASLSSPYCALMASIWGLSACTLSADSTCKKEARAEGGNGEGGLSGLSPSQKRDRRPSEPGQQAARQPARETAGPGAHTSAGTSKFPVQRSLGSLTKRHNFCLAAAGRPKGCGPRRQARLACFLVRGKVTTLMRAVSATMDHP